jgi:hypothetical protein
MGQSQMLHASVMPGDASSKTLIWASKFGKVEVGQDGKVTAKYAGDDVVTATATDGSLKSCAFKIVVEPSVPLELESLGFGVYNGSLLGMTVKNKCARTTIVDFEFDMTLYSYDFSVINSGSFSLGSSEKIAAGAKKTIKRTVYGAGMAKYVEIIITAVKLSDGTYFMIPKSQQETATFSR